jgi:hypothetical protein
MKMNIWILTGTTTKLILANKIQQAKTNFKGFSGDFRRCDGFGNKLSIRQISVIT